jgi:hypothetical protein
VIVPEYYVLESLWKKLGIDRVIRQQAGSRALGFDIERALFALVANRACAPASKFYCHEQWLKEEVRIEGTENLQLHQLYRAMDFLEANREAIEQALFHQVADLLNLDVDLLFYDAIAPLPRISKSRKSPWAKENGGGATVSASTRRKPNGGGHTGKRFSTNSKRNWPVSPKPPGNTAASGSVPCVPAQDRGRFSKEKIL